MSDGCPRAYVGGSGRGRSFPCRGQPKKRRADPPPGRGTKGLKKTQTTGVLAMVQRPVTLLWVLQPGTHAPQWYRIFPIMIQNGSLNLGSPRHPVWSVMSRRHSWLSAKGLPVMKASITPRPNMFGIQPTSIRSKAAEPGSDERS